MRRKSIIAVVGGNKDVPATTQLAAEHVGRAVALVGAILLTGSQPKHGHEVKRLAMRGAVAVNRAAPFSAMLPDYEHAEFAVNSATQRLIETRLPSSERNLITALTSDVMIAFEGAKGTLSEIRFALAANCPVIFVGSLLKFRASLGASLKGEPQSVDVPASPDEPWA
jgi:predicted Rossmann-fold nucleotide-binding protein